MTTAELRPLSLGEVLDRTFSLYRQHFWVFVGIMAFPQLFAMAMGILYVLTLTQMVGTDQPDPARTVAMLGVMMLVMFLMYGGYLLLYIVGQGGTTFAVSELNLGRRPRLGEIFGALRRKIWRLVGITLLAFLLWGGSMFAGALVVMIPAMILALTMGGGSPAAGVWVVAVIFLGWIPGLYVFLRTVLALPIGMVEDVAVADTIVRSWRLTKGAAGRLFLIVVLFLVLSIVGFLLFQAPLIMVMAAMGQNVMMEQGPVWLQVLMQVGAFFSGMLIWPIWAIAFTLLYYDLRVRKEAFDLELMLKNLDPGAQPLASA